MGIHCNTHSFPVLMGAHLHALVCNEAAPCTSIEHAVMSFLNFYQSVLASNCQDCRKYTVLMCLSGFSRSMTYQDGAWQELHPGPVHHNEYSRVYYKFLQSEQQDHLNLVKNIKLTHMLCQQLDMDCYFVSNWDPVPAHALLDQLPIYHKTLTDILQLPQGLNTPGFIKSPYIVPNQCHPNVAGHELIAAELSDWIANHPQNKL